MTETATPPAAQPPAKSWLKTILSVVVGIIALLIGAAKLSETFVLPGCDSSRSLNALKSIFKDKNLPEPTLNGPQIAGGPSNENTCQVDYSIPNEKGVLSYRVYWDGWTPKVMISKAETKP